MQTVECKSLEAMHLCVLNPLLVRMVMCSSVHAYVHVVFTCGPQSRVLLLLCDTPLAIVWLCFSDMGFYSVHSVALIPWNITVPDDVGANMHRSNVCSTLPVSAV